MEAEELANRVLELKNTWPTEEWGSYKEGSIGVLSYYHEQVQRVRIELRKRQLFDVSVERVLNVQGKQFTAVFINTVRTTTSDRYRCYNRPQTLEHTLHTHWNSISTRKFPILTGSPLRRKSKTMVS